MNRALAGDDGAFTELMRRHKAPVHRFAIRYMGEPEAALDIVQETFVAAWRALGRYDERHPFRTWLRAIALNKCRDAARRRLLRRLVSGQALTDGREAREHPDPAQDAETTLIARERMAQLDAAIGALPAPLKEPFILCLFEGLSHDEAADLLGLSRKAVEIRIYRARRRLAEVLGLAS